jgi:hypothetical protein
MVSDPSQEIDAHPSLFIENPRYPVACPTTPSAVLTLLLTLLCREGRVKHGGRAQNDTLWKREGAVAPAHFHRLIGQERTRVCQARLGFDKLFDEFFPAKAAYRSKRARRAPSEIGA